MLDSRLVEFEKSGYSLHLEIPEEFIRALEANIK
jgi:pimeloyl-ACP methyl ester carboxylesterase